MFISTDKGIAALLREGDYFVLRSTAAGLEAEYSPDGPANGPIKGAFAAMNGSVLTWDASEAAELLRTRHGDTEAFLIRELRRSQSRSGTGPVGVGGKEPEPPLEQRLAQNLTDFAKEYAPGGLWQGFMEDLHREFINVFMPGPLNNELRKAILTLPELLSGVTKRGKGPDTLLFIDWDELAAQTPEHNNQE
jgi:hypothetical protein